MKKIDLPKMAKVLYPSIGYSNIRKAEEILHKMWDINSHFHLNTSTLIKKLGLIMYENKQESINDSPEKDFSSLSLVLERRKVLLQELKHAISELESEITNHETCLTLYKEEIMAPDPTNGD